MKFHLLYEIECPRPWGETSIYDGFWEALEHEAAGFETVWSVERHLLDQLRLHDPARASRQPEARRHLRLAAPLRPRSESEVPLVGDRMSIALESNGSRR